MTVVQVVRRLLAACCLGSAAQAQAVREVDHIMIRTGDPTSLYRLFTEVLRLPSAWPLLKRGDATSGGASFGNVNVEAIRFDDQKESAARLVGFAFEPAPLTSALQELRRRKIRYGELRAVSVPARDGSTQTAFTNVTLLDVSDSDDPADATTHVFLCEYNPAYLAVRARRTRLERELQATGGGPMGVVALREIVVGAKDLDRAIALWGRLLGDRRPVARGLWRVGDGPAIRLVPAETNGMLALVVTVSSLARTREFLAQHHLLGAAEDGLTTIDPAATQGIHIRLAERE